MQPLAADSPTQAAQMLMLHDRWVSVAVTGNWLVVRLYSPTLVLLSQVWPWHENRNWVNSPWFSNDMGFWGPRLT